MAALADGKIDVVVGTHRVLSRDVRFRDLGLMVVDEEQRFGVTPQGAPEGAAHAGRRADADRDADPAHAADGDGRPARDLDHRDAARRPAGDPHLRLPLRPDAAGRRRSSASWRAAGSSSSSTTASRTSASSAKRVAELAPEGTRIAIGHGQMPEGELEKVMVDFVDGRYDVLVLHDDHRVGPRHPARQHDDRQPRRPLRPGAALPAARAHRPLARARVLLPGRARGRRASTPEAKQRLAVLQRFTELGAGFQVATHDLEIRGAGELLGERQHGAVAAVGFETYARILEEAVAELRGEPIKPEHDPEITVDVPGLHPRRLRARHRPAAGVLPAARRRRATRTTCARRSPSWPIATARCPTRPTLLGEVMIDKTIVRALGALAYELAPTRHRAVVRARRGAGSRQGDQAGVGARQPLQADARHAPRLQLRRPREARPHARRPRPPRSSSRTCSRQ